jgi:hypothetical protein
MDIKLGLTGKRFGIGREFQAGFGHGQDTCLGVISSSDKNPITQ